jgi:hypothetical protein
MTKWNSKQVVSHLQKLNAQQLEINELSEKMLKADNGRFWAFDFLAIAALKRTKSMSAGFKMLIESRNLVSARALIRMHLDTLMRFYAGWLVENPHTYAEKILNGEKVSNIKDKDGKNLSDSYLATKLNEKFDWVLRVYKTTCGYIHLSDRHIFSAVKPSNKENTCEIIISTEDEYYSESSYLEALDCFSRITEIFLWYIKGWTATKSGVK